MREIVITPSPEEYAVMARTFADGILSDVTRRRQSDSRLLMSSVIELAAYLGAIRRSDLVTALVELYAPDRARTGEGTNR